MKESTVDALERLVDAAKQTSDGWVMSVKLDARDKDELKEIVQELVAAGCISKVSLNGWNGVQCLVDIERSAVYLK